MFDPDPVLNELTQLADDGTKTAGCPLWSLSDTEVVECLRAAYRCEQIAAVLQLRLIREAGSRGLPAERRHRTTMQWLRTELRLDPDPARRLTEQATALATHPALEEAMLTGALDLRQAAVIAAAVDAIPDVLADLQAETDDLRRSSASTGGPDDPAAGRHEPGGGDGEAADGPGGQAADRSDPAAAPGGDGEAADGPGGQAADPAAAPGGGDGEPADGSGSRAADRTERTAPPVSSDGVAADRHEPAVAPGGGDGFGRDAAERDDAAPPRSGDQIADEAEAALLAMAGRFPAHLLRRLGDRILAHVAPEVADRADELALRRQEARARRARTFTLSHPRDGQVRLSGVVSVEDAAVIGAALEPLCRPLPDDARTAGQRRADALTDVCRLALRTTALPEHGGEPAQVTVTVPFDVLAARLGAGVLDNGQRVSAATVRRMACDARILPIVLGSAGQVLDAGRTRRLAAGTLRRALVARDHGCAFPGCDRPARWCDAHHLHPWSAGGRTSLDNLVLLCRHHHTVVHDPTAEWRIQLGADRLPVFSPPPWTDPARRPRRNDFHMRT